MGSLAFALRVTVIGSVHWLPKPERKRAFSRYAIVVYFIGFFRTMSDNVAKQMKGFERKVPSRRRHLSLARADIVRHKSGISLSSPGCVFFFRGLLLVSYDLQLSHFVS